MATCGATADNHCCWLGSAGVCRYFDPDPPADAGGLCSLRYELGSWDAVVADPRYEWVREHLGRGLTRCDEWPRPDERCNTCQVVG